MGRDPRRWGVGEAHVGERERAAAPEAQASQGLPPPVRRCARLASGLRTAPCQLRRSPGEAPPLGFRRRRRESPTRSAPRSPRLSPGRPRGPTRSSRLKNRTGAGRPAPPHCARADHGSPPPGARNNKRNESADPGARSIAWRPLSTDTVGLSPSRSCPWPDERIDCSRGQVGTTARQGGTRRQGTQRARTSYAGRHEHSSRGAPGPHHSGLRGAWECQVRRQSGRGPSYLRRTMAPAVPQGRPRRARGQTPRWAQVEVRGGRADGAPRAGL